jgi:hypothetical protein
MRPRLQYRPVSEERAKGRGARGLVKFELPLPAPTVAELRSETAEPTQGRVSKDQLTLGPSFC